MYGRRLTYIYIQICTWVIFCFSLNDLNIHLLQRWVCLGIHSRIHFWSQVTHRLEYWYDLEFLFWIQNLEYGFAANPTIEIKSQYKFYCVPTLDYTSPCNELRILSTYIYILGTHYTFSPFITKSIIKHQTGGVMLQKYITLTWITVI